MRKIIILMIPLAVLAALLSGGSGSADSGLSRTIVLEVDFTHVDADRGIFHVFLLTVEDLSDEAASADYADLFGKEEFVVFFAENPLGTRIAITPEQAQALLNTEEGDRISINYETTEPTDDERQRWETEPWDGMKVVPADDPDSVTDRDMQEANWRAKHSRTNFVVTILPKK